MAATRVGWSAMVAGVWRGLCFLSVPILTRSTTGRADRTGRGDNEV